MCPPVMPSHAICRLLLAESCHESCLCSRCCCFSDKHQAPVSGAEVGVWLQGSHKISILLCFFLSSTLM